MNIHDTARDAGMRAMPTGWHAMNSDLERFAEAVRLDERMRMARECAQLPFGDTASSFACWIAQGGGQTL